VTVSIQPGQFGPGPQLLASGGYDTATLLSNGKVLFVAGGTGGKAEIYDPCTNQFTWTGSMHDARIQGTAFALPDGRVFIYGGGMGGCCAAPVLSMETYDPATGLFTSLGTPNESGFVFAMPLSNGKILFVGGDPETGPSSTLYDPTTGSWQATANTMASVASWSGAAVVLSGGDKVLFAGGDAGVQIGATTAVLYRYDSSGGTFSATGSLTHARRSPNAVLLADGRILVVGGEDNVGLTNTAERYDPTSGTFQAVGSMHIARSGFTSTALPNGDVLILGGNDAAGEGQVAPAELYHPDGTFTVTDSTSVASWRPTAIVLPNGLVLVVGNGSAELYRP
jgi:WD40 repeat protein